METVLLAILFIIPGLMVRNVEKRLFTKSKEEESDFIKQYNFFIDSTIIYFLGIVAYQLLLITPIADVIRKIRLNGLFLDENSLKLFILYFLWALILCVPYTFIKRYINKKLFLKISKVYRGKTKRNTETEFSSIWDEVFENPEEPIRDDQVIIIEKEGEIITQGYLTSYSPPHFSRREFLLEETEQIKEYLDYDASCENEDEKLLNVMKKVYYDTQTGITIKFADTTKLEKHLQDVDSL